MFKINSQTDVIQLFNGQILSLPRSLEEIEEDTSELISDKYQDNVPEFWKYEKGDHIHVPVDGGEIRVIHFKPDNPIAKRPILLVPGWAVPPITFEDYYEIMHERCELYYLETREKTSSRMKRLAKFNMSQKAKDIGIAIHHLGLDKRDFVLVGTCWGSSMILQGLMDGTVNAPTIVLLDPMYKFTFSRFITFIAPILPVPLLRLMKPFLKKKRIGDMKEKRQLERVNAVVDDAEIWKWKRAANHVRNFSLFGNLHKVHQEIFVVNSTSDYIHDSNNYPNIAHQLAKGRFLRFKADEKNREYVIGAASLEFAKVTQDELPESLLKFEVPMPRNF
ncbi:MAG: hypothetical protein JW776_07740 [Candidatus Lokiarchaeota archaeon]|nr:hypothetical protein [Candidatus Lokiarchaeota archaeon]